MASFAAATAKPIALLPAPTQGGGGCCCWGRSMRTVPAEAARLRVSASASADSSDVPDFLSSNWLETRKRELFGPRLNFSAEEAVEYQLESLKYNDHPHQDYGIEVMYRFAGFDPFERSSYFGRQFDLGQNRFKQRVWVQGSRPEEEAIFQFTMVRRVGGLWDGYWLAESLINDGDAFSGWLEYRTFFALALVKLRGDFLKINVDGAFHETPKSGGWGFIARDHETVSSAFVISFSNSDGCLQRCKALGLSWNCLKLSCMLRSFTTALRFYAAREPSFGATRDDMTLENSLLKLWTRLIGRKSRTDGSPTQSFKFAKPLESRE